MSQRDDIIEQRENTKIVINMGKTKLENYPYNYKLL